MEVVSEYSGQIQNGGLDTEAMADISTYFEDDQNSEITILDNFEENDIESAQDEVHTDGTNTLFSGMTRYYEDYQNSDITMIDVLDNYELESDAEQEHTTYGKEFSDSETSLISIIDEFDDDNLTDENNEIFQDIEIREEHFGHEAIAKSHKRRSFERNYENQKHAACDMELEIDVAEDVNGGDVNDRAGNNNIDALKMKLKQKDQKLMTQKGKPRQRHAFTYSKDERKKVRAQINNIKHTVKPPCSHDYCRSVMSDKQRKKINSDFWRPNFAAKCTFVHSTISRTPCKYRKIDSTGLRENTYTYWLKNDAGTLTSVCKTFYLTTLGYKASNDSFIRKLLGNQNYLKPLPERSEQGKHQKTPVKDRIIITEHINSFNPSISHHRRVHAPKKKYLPSDLTIVLMYSDFIEKHPEFCSYDLYRKILTDDLNISFAHLGHEECETCEEFKVHSDSYSTKDTHTKENLDLNCSHCSTFKVHRDNYDQSRSLHNEHKTLITEDHNYVTGDLQKVVMLPRMDTFKRVIFLPRLIAFNQSFVPIGEGTNNYIKPLGILWHEAISGRKKEDIISTYYKYFLENSTKKKHTIWLDNCSSQNKNWALLAFLVHVVNSKLIKAESIEFHYFEPGHTFMSADYFHHQVEEALKMKKKVYNFEDYVDAVQSANLENVTTAEMKFSDFYEWPNPYSYTKVKNTNPRPYLADMVYIRAERGSMILKYKTSYLSSAEEFPLDFLQVKFLKVGLTLPPTRSGNRGVLKARKDKIIQKLGTLMSDDKLVFWKELPETEVESKLSDD